MHAPPDIFDVVLRVEPRLITPGDDPPGRYVHDYEGSVLLMDENFEPAEAIGAFQVSVLDVESAVIEGSSTFDVFDWKADTVGYYEALFNEHMDFREPVSKLLFGENYGRWEPNTLALQRLVIKREYRGRGYGLLALQALIEEFRVGVGIIAMKPFPLQFEGGIDYHSESKDEEVTKYELGAFTTNFRSARSKLRRYYRRLGFKLVPKTEYMVMAVDDTAKLPVPWMSKG